MGWGDGTRGRLCFQRERRGFSALVLCFSTRFSESFARPALLLLLLRKRLRRERPPGVPCLVLFLAKQPGGWRPDRRPGLGRRGLPGKARARRPQDKKRRRAGGTRGVRPIRSDRASPFVCVREGTVVSGDGGEGVGRASALGSRPAPSSSSRR